MKYKVEMFGHVGVEVTITVEANTEEEAWEEAWKVARKIGDENILYDEIDWTDIASIKLLSKDQTKETE